ncbi:MAG: plastocyanin/azurin family copper-binding protein [Bacteroidota bacterium]|nr:plastocyanin/azurin family copper-binding protein [Sphingobacteriales bacterium]
MKKLFIISSIALALVSCGGGNQQPKTESTVSEQQSTPQTYEFTINAIGNTMAEMSYDTKELKVKAGSNVKVNLTNKGSDPAMLHNIVFVKQGTEKEVAMEGLNLKDQNYFNSSNPNVIAGSAVSQPAATVTVEFTAPEPGTYTYICTYPGHWMAMQGTLIVE